ADRHALFYEHHSHHPDTKVPVENDHSKSAIDLERSRLGDAPPSDIHCLPRIEFCRRLLRKPRQHQSCLTSNSSQNTDDAVTGTLILTHLLRTLPRFVTRSVYLH